jgi:hypothetical protein
LQFRKTQPHYWLATDHNNNEKTKKQRMTEEEKKNKSKGQTGKDYEQRLTEDAQN